MHGYAVGDIAYWSPGPDVAVYYRDDGEEIPNPGIVVIGRIDSGVEVLDVPGSLRVTINDTPSECECSRRINRAFDTDRLPPPSRSRPTSDGG